MYFCNKPINISMQKSKDILKKNNLRKTQAMIKILDIFLIEKEPITADDVYNKFKNRINKSTVYRSILRFVKKKILHEIYISSQKRYYELFEQEHHHHIICINCNTIKDIPCANSFIQNINPNEFNFKKISSHSLEIFGICKNCN